MDVNDTAQVAIPDDALAPCVDGVGEVAGNAMLSVLESAGFSFWQDCCVGAGFRVSAVPDRWWVVYATLPLCVSRTSRSVVWLRSALLHSGYGMW